MACFEKEKLRRLLVVCGHFMYHQTHQGGGQAAVLTLLQKDGPMTQKALQEKLGIRSGSVSELVGKLEAKHLLQREKDPADRRKVVLKLTEEGASRVRFHLPRPPQTLFDGLTDQEGCELTALLEKLLASWEQ